MEPGKSKAFDLIVVGAGPGGYAAAIRGAQRGLKVALISREDPGGTCLHRGCIPSKALIAAAEVVHAARQAKNIGITYAPPQIDYAALIASKDRKVGQLSKGLSELFKAHKIEFVSGEATLKSAQEVEVRQIPSGMLALYQAKDIILATGTEPIRPKGFPFDGQLILTTDELFKITRLPASMVIVGGGVIGCELACAYNILGSEVALVEQLPTLLAGEERLVSQTLQKSLTRRGIDVLTGVAVTEMKKLAGKVAVTLATGSVLEVDLVLVAVGRGVGQDLLGLDTLGVKKNGRYVAVGSHLETSLPRLYAIGDLTGQTLLAHGAAEEGICAVENITGHAAVMDYPSIPRVTYTLPEIASIGMREEELKKLPHKTGRFGYAANAMALLHEEAEGFALIHTSEEGLVLGATVVGPQAAALIQEVALVMKNHLPITALMETIHAHPTFSEVLHEAALDTAGLAIHKFSKR